MTSVEITYCVPCGFRDRALNLAGTVLEYCEGDLDDLRLVMAAHEFRVTVDGEPIWNKNDTPFDREAIASAIRAEV